MTPDEDDVCLSCSAQDRLAAYDEVAAKLQAAQDERNERAGKWFELAALARSGKVTRDEVLRQRAKLDAQGHVWDVGDLLAELLGIHNKDTNQNTKP